MAALKIGVFDCFQDMTLKLKSHSDIAECREVSAKSHGSKEHRCFFNMVEWKGRYVKVNTTNK